MDIQHTDPYDPLYESTEEDDEEFVGRDLTLDECVRLWHESVEWHKHSTLFGTAGFAAVTSEENPVQLRLWIDSVRQVREKGLVDADTSYWLLWSIVDEAVDAEGVLDDPGLAEIGDRMDAFCAAHGRDPDGPDFTYAAYQPPGWKELEVEFAERQVEMRRERLRAAGEHTMLRLMAEDPDEYARRQVIAGRRIKEDYVAERARWSPIEHQYYERLGLGELMPPVPVTPSDLTDIAQRSPLR
jgi:hypothetical protein